MSKAPRPLRLVTVSPRECLCPAGAEWIGLTLGGMPTNFVRALTQAEQLVVANPSIEQLHRSGMEKDYSA